MKMRVDEFVGVEDGFAVAGVEVVDVDAADAVAAGDFDFGVEDHEGGHGVADGGAVDDVAGECAGVADEGRAVAAHDGEEFGEGGFGGGFEVGEGCASADGEVVVGDVDGGEIFDAGEGEDRLGVDAIFVDEDAEVGAAGEDGGVGVLLFEGAGVGKGGGFVEDFVLAIGFGRGWSARRRGRGGFFRGDRRR